MASGSMASGGLNGTSSTSSIWGDVAKIAIPVILSLFGSKKASPQAAAQTTAQQNALALSSLPPELKALLDIQTQNAKAAQPLYLNALNAQNALLPSWARGGGAGATGGITPLPGSASPGSVVPSIAAKQPGNWAPGDPANPTPNVGGGVGGSDHTPMLSNPDSPFSGVGVDNGLVPGNSLDPQTVMAILGVLTGNPAFGALSPFLKKPVATTSDTNFTLT